MKFENGRHLTNYLLKIIRNTTEKLTRDEERILKRFTYLYDFLEFYVDVVECPVIFDSSFSTWIGYAQKGNVKRLCEIVESSLNKIREFKSKTTSFDELFCCLDLDMKYRCGYLEMKPKNSDIYYPNTLEVISTRIRKSTGIIYCYTNPKQLLSNNIGCYFIYDYEDKNKIVYVGKSNSNLFNRACSSTRERVDNKFSKIELLEMPTQADTNIYEMYYIAKYNPIYNCDARCPDNPTCKLTDIAKHHFIELVKEEPFSIKQICFEKEFVSKEEFWSNGNYVLYNEKNIENKRKEISGNTQGIVDGEYIFTRRELYEKDGYLCTLHVTEKSMEAVA